MNRLFLLLLATATACTTQPPRDRGAPPAPSGPASASAPAADTKTPLLPRDGLAAGGAHTCLLRKGEVRCWGKNDAGQLGNGTRREASAPAVVKGLVEPVRIAVGHAHSCALEATGHVQCWGQNTELALGHTPDDPTRPSRVPDLDDVIDIAAGRTHTCALKATGFIVCWGGGPYGELGRGTAAGASLRPVMGISDAVSIAANQTHTCARTRGGDVRCWGGHWLSGFFGERQATGERGRDLPFSIASLKGAEGLAIGAEHVCGLRAGEVLCHGANVDAQLGDPASPCCEHAGVGAKVARLADAAQIAAGFRFTCARRRAGDVVCWGGVMSAREQGISPPVKGLTDVVDLAAGDEHVCALRKAGEVLCWGDDTFGQLGGGEGARVTRPAKVSGIDDAEQLAVGYIHTCVKRRGDRVSCWGPSPDQASPADVPELAGPGSLGSGIYESCMLPPRGPVRCVGRGRGPFPPGEIKVPPGAQRLVHGGAGICVGAAGGDVACVPEHSDAHSIPSQLPGRKARSLGASFVGARAIAVGQEKICGLLGSAVRCVNEEFTGTSPAPDTRGFTAPEVVPLLDASDVTALALGGHHGCAVMRGGSARCWGSNGSGQLGDGSTKASATPVAVAGLGDVAALAAGTNHTCALRTDGGVWCWGDDGWGQIGDGRGDLGRRETPVAVAGVSDAVEIGAGSEHTCARIKAGSVLCWGSNENGRLGIGRRLRADTPVPVRGLGE